MSGPEDQPDDAATRAPGTATPQGERVGGMLVHLLGIVTVFLVPLALFLAYRNRTTFVRDHSAQALNFQTSMAVAYILAGSLVVVPIVSLPVVWFVCGVVLLYDIGYAVKAGRAAHRGDRFRYPLAIPIIKT